MDADRLRRLQHPVCLASGAVLAAIYLYWQYVYNHWIATYTWMVPFGVGYVIPLFIFSLKISRAERPPDPELPKARAVTAPPPPTVPVVVVKAPERTQATDPNEQPTLLK